ncbi:MAG: hypothetical protein ACFE8L_06515, partial [Candidatus Hodarchaeota archaeon]
MPVCKKCGAETPEDEYKLYSGQCRACHESKLNKDESITRNQHAIFETTPVPSIEEIKRFSKYKRTIKTGKRSGTKVWLIISLIIGVIGAIIGFIYGFSLWSWIGAGVVALIGFGVGFLIPTIFMILAKLAKTKYFILLLLLITGIIGAVIGGFIGARIGQVALGILIGF